MLGVTLVLLSLPPALASEPPPTPPPPALEAGCQLRVGVECLVELPRLPAELAANKPLLHPRPGAVQVPVYTQVAINLPLLLDPASIQPHVFTLSNGGLPVAGTLDYVAPAGVLVFAPAQPLHPNTAYTVTLTTEVRTVTGQRLPAPLQWRFTTAPAQAEAEITQAGSTASVGGLNVYFGDLHSHTGYSDGPAGSTPATAYAVARANGIDFFAVTDHAFLLSDAEWTAMRQQAISATVNGQFVALAAYEFTHPDGHLNVFNTDTLVKFNNPAYDTLTEFYDWLVADPTAFAQFNHPARDNDANFLNFKWHPLADQKIVLQELTNTTQFFLSLNTGWHLGSLLNSDTHLPTWGCCPMMGVVAPALTQPDILAALQARRTFFSTPNDNNFAVVMRANGYWMGSALPNTGWLNFTVNAFDPDPDGRPVRFVLYENGVVVASTAQSSAASYAWTPGVPARLGRYYYVEAYKAGWLYPSYTSPVWVEQPPLAEAGAAQLVPVGAAVTLNGGGSTDPDGDPLAYRWTQTGGPAVTITQSGPLDSRATLTAPATSAEVQVQLEVIDTGGLTGADVVTISATDRPYLQISKQGPAEARPGVPVNYTLTVTNVGASEAVGVTVTDVVPAGATYSSGGNYNPQTNQVTWTVPTLGAKGGVAHVSFTVISNGGPIVNRDYRADCSNCVPGIGQVAVYTNPQLTHLPVIFR